MILTKQEIIEALKAHKCVIKFTKVNGEVREMPCTLREDIVPKYERKTPIKETAKETDLISVWCLDKGAWRSFHASSVSELKLELGMPIVI